jgi:hypothetical protein
VNLFQGLLEARRADSAQCLEDPRPRGRATPMREGGSASRNMYMFKNIMK